MAGTTDRAYNEKQRHAVSLITAAGGITKLDKLDDLSNTDPKIKQRILLGFCGQMQMRYGITYQTARNHVERACRRMRSPTFDPASNVRGRGGARRGKKSTAS